MNSNFRFKFFGPLLPVKGEIFSRVEQKFKSRLHRLTEEFFSE